MNQGTSVRILKQVVCISQCSYLSKSMRTYMGLKCSRRGSLTLVWQPIKKKDSEFQPLLKIDLTARAVGLVNFDKLRAVYTINYSSVVKCSY